MPGGDSVTPKVGYLVTNYIDINTGSLIIPLSADFTTANVQDNQMYNPMISSSYPPLPSHRHYLCPQKHAS